MRQSENNMFLLPLLLSLLFQFFEVEKHASENLTILCLGRKYFAVSPEYPSIITPSSIVKSGQVSMTIPFFEHEAHTSPLLPPPPAPGPRLNKNNLPLSQSVLSLTSFMSALCVCVCACECVCVCVCVCACARACV